MRSRHPLPRLWLFTDERQGRSLSNALARLPRGSGVVFRHYSLDATERQALYEQVLGIARTRRLTVLLSRPHPGWRGDGLYGNRRGARGLLASPVHDLKEIRQAERHGADLLFLSPLFPTRSHAGARALGKVRFARLAHATRLPVVALGGVTARHAALLRGIGAYGRAGIDAFIES